MGTIMRGIEQYLLSTVGEERALEQAGQSGQVGDLVEGPSRGNTWLSLWGSLFSKSEFWRKFHVTPGPLYCDLVVYLYMDMVCANMCVNIYVNMCLNICVNMSVNMCVNMCVNKHVCKHVCKHM